MSISSILAFVLAGVAARAESVQVAKPSKDRIAELEGERDRQYEANVGLIVRIAELEDDVARANVQFRRDQELIDMWRSRADEWRTRAAGRDEQWAMRQAQQAQQGLAQYAQQSQYAYQQQHNAYQNGLYHNAQAQGLGAIGLLGAQNLIDAELWCNCVPSRSQVWATSDPE